MHKARSAGAAPVVPSLQAIRKQLQKELSLVKALRTECEGLQSGVQPSEPKGSDIPASENNYSEWKTRYETQLEYNQKLQEQVDSLKKTILHEKDSSKQGKAIDGGIAEMSTANLKRFITKLTRGKNDVQSQLRDYEWRLDQEANLFHKVDEKRNRMLMDMKKRNPSAHPVDKTVKDKAKQSSLGYASLAAKRKAVKKRLTKSSFKAPQET